MTTLFVHPRSEAFAPFREKGGNPFKGMDYEALLKLPDEEFAQRYLGEMTLYFYEHGEQMLREFRQGFSRGLRPIPCTDCREEIECAADLRRYYGNSLHHACFVEKWREERPSHVDRNPSRKYWDKIAGLDPQQLRSLLTSSA